VKEVRPDVAPERLPDGPEGRCSVDIVAVHRRDACLAARPGGIGRGQKVLPDEQEIVARALERRQDAAHRVPQPQDVLRRVRPAPRQVQWDAAALQAWALMGQVLPQQVSRALATTPALRTEQFRAAQRRVQSWLGASLSDELPRVAARQRDARLPELPQNLAVRFRASPSMSAWCLLRVSPQSHRGLTARQHSD
jgi:hypothetical protein